MILSFVLEGSIVILCIFLGILITNLCTFKRLHPAQQPAQSGQRNGAGLLRFLRWNERRDIPGGCPASPRAWGHLGTIPPSQTAGARSTARDVPTFIPPYDGTMEPVVSILVPARNEEGSIEACVQSLLAQDYGPLEVLVLDDQSNDATALLVQRMIDELPEIQRTRLRLLKGGELPPGWIGKNFACQQLAQQARGEYLLFTDADTMHKPQMLQTILDAMHREQVQLLTGQPEQLLGSPGERLIVPLLNFTILTLLPVTLIRRRPEPSLATGNGQLLCFQRAAYEKIGGHAVVRDRILEDVLLARRIKAAGYAMNFVDALELVQCRMYRSWHEVWAGFSKNLFAFYNYSLPFALFALVLNLVLFVLPVLLLLSALFLPTLQYALLSALIAYGLAVAMRVLLTLRFIHIQRGLMLLYSFLHPLSIALECLILVNAIRWRYGKSGTTWKGRRYL